MIPVIENPEIIIGVIGRIGVDTRGVVSSIEKILKLYDYNSFEIHVSDLVGAVKTGVEIKEKPLKDRYDSLISACNEHRRITGRKDAMALLAISAIRNKRHEMSDDKSTPQPRQTYIINQLKRPEEVEILRSVYGERFLLISCHASKEDREITLKERMRLQGVGYSTEAELSCTVISLIEIDENEEGDMNGQRVRQAFPLADLFVDAKTADTAEVGLIRFFAALFGDPKISPNKDEYSAHIATNVSLRSTDLSRQVGAAIFSDTGEIISIGCNEVPKAGGGTYWTEDIDDKRDFKKGYDYNTIQKTGMVVDIISRLRNNGWLKSEYEGITDDKIKNDHIFPSDGMLHEALILDSLEYGRVLHAEMCALTDAARNGLSVKKGKLYCNTFPCHNCAKHIVGSGIAEVIYQKPYPKSAVAQLYPDSIEIDSSKPDPNKILFRQFLGIGSNRYRLLFSKSSNKNPDGSFKEFDPKKASPLKETFTDEYLRLEASVVSGTPK